MLTHCTMAISPASLISQGACSTHPSGVAAPGVPRPLFPPSNASCASRSFCSIASARRLRKSESATRPTVCVLSRSSAVFAWGVKRGLGVDPPEGGFDAMMFVEALGECLEDEALPGKVLVAQMMIDASKVDVFDRGEIWRKGVFA